MSTGDLMTLRMCEPEYSDMLDSMQVLEPYFDCSRKRSRSPSVDNRASPTMSGYYYLPDDVPMEEEDFDFEQSFTTQSGQPQTVYAPYLGQAMPPSVAQQPFYPDPNQFFAAPPQLQHSYSFPTTLPPGWMTPTVPSNYPMPQQDPIPFPQYVDSAVTQQDTVVAGSSRRPSGYLSPDEAIIPRSSRATSFASSNASSVYSHEGSEPSRSASPNASEMLRWGYRNDKGTWSCRYPGCTSRSTFNRGCDLRKHYKRHQKSLFCRHDGCPQATEGGFSSKKDRARHEAKHNPNIVCEYQSEGCDRLFSRVDNMKDHVKRVHLKRSSTQ